jgi:DNA invertase Pin-like site-specific DNA recombinase
MEGENPLGRLGEDAVAQRSESDVVPFEAGAMSALLDWAAWLLVGAIGALLAVLVAVAVAHAYRRRDGSSSPPSPQPATGAPSSRGEPARATATTTGSSRMAPGSRVIGYLTSEDDVGGTDDKDSVAAIDAACERSGWNLVEVVRDTHAGPALGRPGLRYALERIGRAEAQGLVMNDLERLSRSIVELGTLLAWFRDADASLIALDLDVDTSTPEGRHVAKTLIALSARDHERIASGTRRGLAKGRASGRPTGRPAVSHRPELVERIAAMRAANMTLQAIADQLNAEGVPTLRGGKKWRPSSIQAALGYRRPGPGDQLPSRSAKTGR